MDILSNVLLKLKDTRRIAEELPATLSYIVADQKRTELRLGIGGNKNSAIVGYYKDMKYATWKQTLPSYKAPWLIPDLYVTGRFHRSIKAEYHSGGYDLYLDPTSSPPYANKLWDDYKQPDGITDAGQFKAAEKIETQMNKAIRNIWKG